MQKEQSRECKSKRIQEMHRRVCQIKASEKAEVKYMQTWEEKIIERQEGKEEGRIVGMVEAILDLLLELGDVPDALREGIMSQKDRETLHVWLKMAAKAESVEAFRREAGI